MSYARLTAENAAVLFVDHQTGLANGVQTQSPPDFINNVRALVTITQIYNLPAVITASAAVKASGRKKLLIAGISTEVCVAFAALSARELGYDVYAVLDASGTWSKLVEEAAIARMVQAGVNPIARVAVASYWVPGNPLQEKRTPSLWGITYRSRLQSG